METKQLSSIIENAPDGATHVSTIDEPFYFKKSGKRGGVWLAYVNKSNWVKWENSIPSSASRISDLNKIKELQTKLISITKK